MQNQRKLKNYLIKKNMQLRITAKFLVFAVLCGIIGELMVYLILWPTFAPLMTPEIFKMVKLNVMFILLWANTTLIILIVLFGIVLTHSVAGPAYKMEQKLTQFLEGEDIEPIHLRKGDELHELADAINKLIQKVKDTKPS